MLKKLDANDYRQIVKEWINRQPDERTYVFLSSDRCVVGQFLSDNPAYDDGRGYIGDGAVWTATHHGAAIMALSGSSIFNGWAPQNFGDLKARINYDPAWA